MSWVPSGLTLNYPGARPYYSASNVETSDWSSCPVKVGIGARRARVDGEAAGAPFDSLLVANIKAAIDGLLAGRTVDAETGLARARATYATRHPGVRAFLDAAMENYLDFLDSREAVTGPLTYCDFSHRRTVTSDFEVKMWAPVFTDPQGNPEVHRLRYGEARRDVTEWAVAVAWIVGKEKPATVIEVGLTAGSEQVLLDSAEPGEIHKRFEVEVLPRLREAHSATDPVPGSDCSDCKAAPACEALIPVDAFRGLRDSVASVRALSASDLRVYRSCPAAWYLHSIRLPKTPLTGEALERGRRVHEWIAQQHSSGRSCPGVLADASAVEPGDLPLLRAHADFCDRSGWSPVSVEETLVAWDDRAQLVLYLKPDELYLRGDTLVLREIKTTDKVVLHQSQTAARDEYADVLAWWLAILSGGLAEYFGATRAEVELEVLTPAGGARYTFPTDDTSSDYVVNGWLLDAPDAWMNDTSWLPNPGPRCASCDVARWCEYGAT